MDWTRKIVIVDAAFLEQTTTSRHVCTVPAEFSAVVWRLTFSAVPFPDFL